MSLSSENMMKLMAYADGECQGPELAEVQKLLAKEPDAVRFVEQVAGLGDFVKTSQPEAVTTFDIADAVMAKVKDIEPEAAKPTAKVVSLADAKKKRTQQITVGAGIIAALALAASIFLFKKPEETPMAKAPTPVPANAVQGASGVEVETAAESPGQSVKVFYGPGQNEMSTSVVIWVEEK